MLELLRDLRLVRASLGLFISKLGFSAFTTVTKNDSSEHWRPLFTELAPRGRWQCIFLSVSNIFDLGQGHFLKTRGHSKSLAASSQSFADVHVYI